MIAALTQLIAHLSQTTHDSELKASEDTPIKSLWRKVMEIAQAQPAMAWIQQLELVDLMEDTAYLVPKPGQREIFKFAATPRNQDKLSEILSGIQNRKILISLSEQAEGSKAVASQNSNAAGAKVSLTEIVTQGELMKKVMDAFPDARIVGIKELSEPLPKPDQSDDTNT